MKHHILLLPILLTTSLISLPSATIAQSNKSVDFYCGRTKASKNTPATMAKRNGVEGDGIAIVVWSDLPNISAIDRCEKVSKRFRQAWQQGNFNLMGSGVNSNGQGTICALKDRQQPCDNKTMLFTLKNGQQAKETIERLEKIFRSNVVEQPIYQSGDGFPIFDMQRLVNTLSQSKN